MQRVFSLLIKGIGAALVCFTLGGIIWDTINSGNYTLTNWAYTKMVVGCIIVGTGFSLPALIYYGNWVCNFFDYSLYCWMDTCSDGNMEMHPYSYSGTVFISSALDYLCGLL